ncbi:MAG: urea ABC transporter permease subunit UrtB [Alphaproteobacteria bacterium]|nr:urea ABC transporter permease subunit UrtB [Alphaproteobacteria bacterium]MBU1559995.1 urea ABC transporter permease subunit UrtB [Alphaproteobacteria bacterium]MBU2302297.1 urea ABC transporter permease subunit UrtB [Alphaproteobacteria bacterium]MBU2369429.1 urea ABC transporter permease subunit UrtB [Alphaproteobacteria bacterium]
MNAISLLRTIALFLALTLGLASPAQAQVADAELTPLVDALAPGNFKDREAAIGVLVATGDPRVVPVLEVLLEGELYFDEASGKVVFTSEAGGEGTISDPATGAELPDLTEDGLDKVKVNNGLRRVLRTAIGQMTLLSEDPGVRLFAAQSILRDADPAQLELLDSAIAAETDASIRRVMEQARAAIILKTPDASVEDWQAAIPVVQAIGGRDALNTLTTALNTAPEAVKPLIQTAIDGLARDRAVWDVAQNVWFGISLGSVLLLAAIGLAITFGVMGVINMAHGEMVMLGAYTTFVVQEVIRQNFPGLFDWSLAIALPLAFLVTGLIGIAIERGVIRFLYGRPLETLLATWGLSLIIQQAVQRIFTANIREVGNPTWMSGSFELGGLAITWNRFYIVIFALMVFVALLLVLKYTAIGLHMRAVTQNRRMASAMGIRTPLVDAMTFGLGSGIAGLAGVALSQIGNVSPNLGQGYIIDSFMVVVFGGVGNLWGTLVGALTLGIANKFIEPYAGAVLGKIIILVLIILFIQRRPRGLFALKGRSIEA